MNLFSQQTGLDAIDLLFIVRLFPLALALFISIRGNNLLGAIISVLYLCVTTVNFIFSDPALNAIFSTPLVFFTAWYIIKHDTFNRRNRKIKFVKKEKK